MHGPGFGNVVIICGLQAKHHSRSESVICFFLRGGGLAYFNRDLQRTFGPLAEIRDVVGANQTVLCFDFTGSGGVFCLDGVVFMALKTVYFLILKIF